MDISSKIFSSTGLNYSDYIFHNGTALENSFPLPSVAFIIIILFALLTNSYVIWLIVSGTANGLAAELFSLNLFICEIIFCLESLLNLSGLLDGNLGLTVSFLYGLSMTGRLVFQCVICVERYLAVVHPVIFLKYKHLRYRLICCVFVWMLNFISGVVNIIPSDITQVYYILFAQFVFFLSVMLFCCLAVLVALKQSGPGDRNGERPEKNQMKRKAFYVILITAVTLLIMYTLYLTLEGLYNSPNDNGMFIFIASICFFLTSLVQPLLFLHRVKKMPFIKYQ